MNKKLLIFLFVLLLLFLGLASFLLFSSPELLLSDRTQKILTETMGVDLWKKNQKDDLQRDKKITFNEFGIREEQFDKPSTEFVLESAQRIDGSILSRGYDVDGFERVMLRGQFGSWQDVSLLADTLGRKAFTIQSAGKEWTIYTGKTVKIKCQNRMFYDKNGKGHDLTKAMVEYDQHLDDATLVSTEKM